ncbi:MAG: hypothetical protein COW88_02695 [Candidatus Lloydbacteria bacterium CG22_combo_CG10-13_8_21_14_all_47_15]|uniref:Glutamate/phenylalanine/leucine/valine/L-tryptophan dehydrogenase C-terminal domain-containing protein n=1 Tax=Candidatus Lloydbacteria bacterium CG22_combo_CG10-13_8_21_14_all_47_15 TaxID=1974635 RepID=A0A2H0CTP7_9BACT|nr:MAG: hypothetical protein COW88_02695 [Candidatus Lloydbacteria bacterium CG22_combo_CG10-13_8_21_14_all_47_15]
MAMDIFPEMAQRGFEGGLHYYTNSQVGLRCIIAIHHTRPSRYGSALGGVRMCVYRSQQEAEYDVLRLARGMTLKNLVAGIDVGGGKAVILLNQPLKGAEGARKKERILRAFGENVERLHGEYITAPDAGTNSSDMKIIGETTGFVVGLVDPSPRTATGVYTAMKVGAEHLWRTDSLKGKRVLIQGAGKTGKILAALLAEEEAQLIISDVDIPEMDAVCKRYDALHCLPEDVFNMDADIFAPCALGGIVNDNTIHHIIAHFAMVCGSANNQLGISKTHGRQLKEGGVLYLPDFVVNSGGVIASYCELTHGVDWIYEHADDIDARVQSQVAGQVMTILRKSSGEKFLATSEIAEKIALEILSYEENGAHE